MITYLSKFRAITHLIALGIIGAAGWIVSNPQIVGPIAAKYHTATTIVAAAGVILALYHKSTN